MTSLIKVHIMYMYTCVKLFTTHTCSSRDGVLSSHTPVLQEYGVLYHTCIRRNLHLLIDCLLHVLKNKDVHCTSYGKVLVNVFLSMTYVSVLICKCKAISITQNEIKV